MKLTLFLALAGSSVLWLVTYWCCHHRKSLVDIQSHGTNAQAASAGKRVPALTVLAKLMFVVAPIPIALKLGVLLAPHANALAAKTLEPFGQESLAGALIAAAFGLLAYFRDVVLAHRIGRLSFVVFTLVSVLSVLAMAIGVFYVTGSTASP